MVATTRTLHMGRTTGRLSRNLNVNIGLRWDYFPPFYEARNAVSFLNPTMNNPAVNYHGALQFAGGGTDGCNCKSPINTWYKNFGPRLGMAYSLNTKTVLRAAYALNFSHATGGNNIGRSGTGSLGYSANPSPASPGSGLPVFILDNGFPSYQVPPFIDPTFGTGYSTTINGAGSDDHLRRSVRWIAVRRAPSTGMWASERRKPIIGDMVINGERHVGSQGHFLPPSSGNARGFWSNELDPKYYNLGTHIAERVAQRQAKYRSRRRPSIQGSRCPTRRSAGRGRRLRRCFFRFRSTRAYPTSMATLPIPITTRCN